MEKQLRKKTRFIANFEGLYRFKNSPDWKECYIYDISETGAQLRINQSLYEGDQLEICFDIDHKRDIVKGTVVNVLGQIAGIKFDQADAKIIIDCAIERAFSRSRTPKKTYGE